LLTSKNILVWNKSSYTCIILLCCYWWARSYHSWNRRH